MFYPCFISVINGYKRIFELSVEHRWYIVRKQFGKVVGLDHHSLYLALGCYFIQLEYRTTAKESQSRGLYVVINEIGSYVNGSACEQSNPYSR